MLQDEVDNGRVGKEWEVDLWPKLQSLNKKSINVL